MSFKTAPPRLVAVTTTTTTTTSMLVVLFLCCVLVVDARRAQRGTQQQQRPADYFRDAPLRPGRPGHRLRPEASAADEHHTPQRPMLLLHSMRDWRELQHNHAYFVLVLDVDQCGSAAPRTQSHSRSGSGLSSSSSSGGGGGGGARGMSCKAIAAAWHRVADAFPEMHFALVNFSVTRAEEQQRLLLGNHRVDLDPATNELVYDSTRSLSGGPFTDPDEDGAAYSSSSPSSREHSMGYYSRDAVVRTIDAMVRVLPRFASETQDEFNERAAAFREGQEIIRDEPLWMARQFVALYCRTAELPALVLIADRSARATVFERVAPAQWHGVVEREQQRLELHEDGFRWKRHARRSPLPPLPPRRPAEQHVDEL